MAAVPVKPDNMTENQFLDMIGQMQFGESRESTLGPILIGFAADLLLLGVLVHQAVLWSHHQKVERRFTWYITLWVIASCMANTGVIVYYVWSLFVEGFGHFSSLLKTDKTGLLVCMSVLTTVPVQIFYMERAYRLLRNAIWLPFLVTPFILVSLAGGLGTTIIARTMPSIFDVAQLNKFFYVWMSGTVAADLLLTALIMYGLMINKTGWSNTDRTINRLIRTVIETQVPPTVIGVTFLVSYSIKGESLLNTMWEMFHAKFYAVSLLAVLNYRYTLRKTMETGPASGGKDDNTFALEQRHQQRTMDLGMSQTATAVSKEWLNTDKSSKRSPTPDGGDSELGQPEDHPYSSTAVLTHHGR